MEASISFWRAMRCCHQFSCSVFTSGGQASSTSRGDLPFFPTRAKGGVDPLAQRLQRLLEVLPDDVDFGVVGDAAKSDVRYALIDKALADVTIAVGFGWGLTLDFGLLQLTFAAVGLADNRG